MKKIGKDKWKHFYVGIFLGLLFQFTFSFLFSFSPLNSLIVSFVIIAAIAFGFELFSLYSGYGHYDFMDAIASILGGAMGQALLLPFIF